jgi:hypothetical protein
MAVVINDFEVVSEQAPAQAATGADETQPVQAPAPSALQLERVQRHVTARDWRVTAD